VYDPARTPPFDQIMGGGGEQAKESGYLDVYFVDADSGDVIGYSIDVLSGSSASYEWSIEQEGTYQWMVAITDGEYWTFSDTYSFTYNKGTGSPPDPPSDPSPSPGSTVQEDSVFLRCWVKDPDGDELTVEFYDGNTHSLIGEDYVSSNSWAEVEWFLPEFGYYTWYVIVSDTEHSTNGPYWDFSYEENNPPDQPHSEYPSNGQNNVWPSNLELQCYVSDNDGDSLTVNFFILGQGLIGTDIVDGMGTATLSGYSFSFGQTYQWYVTIYDGEFTTTGPTWSFTTAT